MTISEMHERILALGITPHRSLGQNFLFDQNLANKIVSALDIEVGDHVVEIGPGLGALTEILVRCASSLTIIEKDDRLIGWLNETFGCLPHVTVVHADALEFDIRTVLGRGPLRVIGNLPYYVSTPLIERFADPVLGAKKLVFTLQKELGERLTANHSTKIFGAMTLCLGRRWDVRMVRTLPACVFYPAPKVESAVVSFSPRPAADVEVLDDQDFYRLVRAGFSERRKQLRKLLPGVDAALWRETAAALGLPEDVRAEALGHAKWTALVAMLAPGEAQRSDEMFDVVDENDHVLESLPRDLVHARDLRHRAVHVMLFNRAGEVFLQKRSIWKDRNPALWDSSSAGHVDSGESYEIAAHRELMEELGVDSEIHSVCKLGSGPETGHEFLQIFHGMHDGPFSFAATEVEGGMFFDCDHVTRWLASYPGDFTPIFKMAFPIVMQARMESK